jgi:hypothetical protein
MEGMNDWKAEQQTREEQYLRRIINLESEVSKLRIELTTAHQSHVRATASHGFNLSSSVMTATLPDPNLFPYNMSEQQLATYSIMGSYNKRMIHDTNPFSLDSGD